MTKYLTKAFSTWCAAVAVGLVLTNGLEASYQVETIAGAVGSSSNLDGTGTIARFVSPGMMSIDSSGNLYVPDTDNNIRQITTAGGTYSVSTLFKPSYAVRQVEAVYPYGNTLLITDGYTNLFHSSKDGTSHGYQITNFPSGGAGWGLAVDSNSNIYMTDKIHQVIWQVNPSSTTSWSVFAGTYNSAGANDGTETGSSVKHTNGSGIKFNGPTGLAIDSSNNLYVCDTGNNTIHMITPGGASTTIAGNAGTSGSADGVGSAATFNSPWGISIDAAGNLFVVDQGNNTIRKLTNSSGTYTVSTIAGTAGSSGSSDGLGTAARFNNPTGIAVDALGNIYVSDTNNDTIRKLSLQSQVTTLEVDFTDGAVMAGPVTGSVKFVGGSSSNVCTFSGSATQDVQVTVGKVVLSSAAPIASGKSMHLNGGDLIVTAGFELPKVAMDQAGNLNVNTNGTVGLTTLTGSGALTITTTNSGTGSVHLEDLSANSGGIVACSQPVVIDSATKFPSNTCTIQGVATVNAAPGQASTHNLTFGEIDATTVNTAASSLTSATLYATKVKVGTKAWLHNVTAH